MEALAARLYRSRPRHFVAIMQALGLVLDVVAIGPLSVGAALVLFDFSTGETAVVAGTTVALAALGTVVASALSRPLRGPVNAWARGERGDPILVWRCGTRLTKQLTTRICLVTLVLGSPVHLVLVREVFDRSWAITLGLQAAFVMVAVVGWMVVAFVFDLAMRPLVAEAEQLAGLAFRPPTDARLGRDLALGAAALTLGSTSLSAGFMTLTTESDWQPLAAVGIAVGISAWTVTIFVVLVTQPLLQPVRDLTRGIQRVAAGDYATPVPVATADELGELAASFNAMQHGLQERESLHAAFGTFVDPSLTTRLLELGDDAFAGDAVEVTVLFVDVRGFTAYAGTVEPTDAVATLNRLFAIVVPVVRQHAGHPNHFLGDGLLAVFGAPDPLEDHADHAVAAALDIQRAVRSELGGELQVGIGLNTGKVIAGTIGGGGKLEYTVIGDAVNVAARVEQLTKVTGDGILVTEATAASLSSRAALVDRGQHEVRGKAAPITVLAVPC